MGVHGLTAILKRYAPKSVRTVSCNAFSQQTIAIDASCHLNKFIYGIEGHPHPHLYGFYQLARFCSLNKITPLFVFDGPHRLDAKKLEHAKRARSRLKVKHSLRFEKEQSVRLDSWSQVSDQYNQAYMAKELLEIKEGAMATDNKSLKQELRARTLAIAQELKEAIIMAEDTEKYTRTVRAMANKEKDAMLDAATSEFKDDKSALYELQKENEDMVSSLDHLELPKA
ncbi:PIN domain-like protein [Parasitella parasitica]|nr:PIN domain-like protein [Parasitella parasitica]